MTENELRVLLDGLRNQPGETECLEFKEAKTDYDFKKLGKYFTALCNEANLKHKRHAWLIFGVKDAPLPREIVGSQYRYNRVALDSLKGEIADKTSIGITFDEIYELTYEGKRVLMFKIPPAPRGIPIAWDGHYYGRDGEELGPLNIQEIEAIRGQATATDWSSQVIPTATIHDLDEAAILKAREEYKKKTPSLAVESDSWDTITFLNKAKLTIQGAITNTAILLLGKPESTHFLSPSVARISWILRDEKDIEKDYEHFDPPFILTTTKLFHKIRNLTYRYLPSESLFPNEIKTYEPYVIREALHNCIAHQDYSLASRITVVEKPDELAFTNAGSFMPGDVDTVISQDAPQIFYRNSFLAEAMVNLNMIDTIGSGIKKMFIEQRNRFFPLPDYELNKPDMVTVKISGTILDENYTRLLINNSDIDLKTVMLLDRVQKKMSLTDIELGYLRKQKLIEGRKPNIHVSAGIAKVTGESTKYIRDKGFDDEYYQDLILKYIEKFSSASRKSIEDLLKDKLPDILNDKQKSDKVKNLIQKLKSKGKIELTEDRKWTILN